MPELPEVEVTRRGLDEPLRGAEVLVVRVGKALRWPLGIDPQALVGSVVGAVRRRGKYLWLPLARGDSGANAGAEGGLLIHLGMSGSLALHAASPPPSAHDHFDLVTSHGTLRLTDPRRFGAVVWSPSIDEPPASRLLASLGAEPFDESLTPAAFHAALQRFRAPVKAVLLSGRVVVGAGNIYACEALHEAGIHPATPASAIGPRRAARLLDALRATLARAIELGGSTLRDFRDVHGAGGEFQLQARVYGRVGAPCPRCGAAVLRVVQSQRATYFCARCQRR